MNYYYKKKSKNIENKIFHIIFFISSLAFIIALFTISQSFPMKYNSFGQNNHNSLNGDTLYTFPIKPKCANSWEIVGYTQITDWISANDTYDWISGQGTIESPFTIENVSFNANGLQYALLISAGTSYYFEILNCTFFNSHPNYSGLRLNSNNGTIENCTFTQNREGLYLDGISNIIIHNSTFTENSNAGCYIEDSSQIYISECNFIKSPFYGLNSIRNTDLQIIKNNFSENLYGIRTYQTENSTFSLNQIRKHSTGFYLDTASNFLNITGNWIENCTISPFPYGIYGAYDSFDCQITNNDLTNCNSAILFGSSAQRFIFANNRITDCVNTGIELSGGNHQFINNNISNMEYGFDVSNLENITITGGKITNISHYALSISVNNLTISEVTITNSNNGIHCTGENITIKSCDVENITNTAIGVGDCPNSSIQDNMILNATQGISAQSDIQIIDNEIYQCEWLIYLSNSVGFLVKNNTLAYHRNGYIGPLLRVANSQNGTILNNIMMHSSQYGIYFSQSTNITIEGNSFFNSSLFDIYIFDLNPYVLNIYRNSFLSEKESYIGGSISEIYCNNSIMGNYWKFYHGSDNDGDGIGEEAFEVNSASSLFDFKPIETASFTTFDPQPDNATFDFSNATGTFQWVLQNHQLFNPSVPNPFKHFQNYTIFLNDSPYSDGFWDYETPIPVSFSSLSLGVWNYTLNITDEWGNLLSDTVTLEVINILPTISSENSFSGDTIEIGSEDNYIRFSVEDPSAASFTFNISVDGTLIQTNQMLPSSNFTEFFLNSYDLGELNILFEVLDGYGGYNSISVNVYVNNSIPATIVSSSNNGEWIEIGSSANITFTVLDPSITSLLANVTINSTPFLTNINITSAQDYCLLLNSFTLGEYIILFEVLDGYGGYNSTLVSFSINNTAPILESIATFTESVVEVGALENITISITDPSILTLLMNITLNGELLLTNEDLTSSHEFSLSTASLLPGNYTIIFTILDGYGGFDAIEYNITVNNTTPIIYATPSFISDTFVEGSSGNSLLFEIIDPSIAVGLFNITLNGEDLVINGILGDNHSIYLTLDTLLEGEYNLTLSFADGYGELVFFEYRFTVSPATADDTADDSTDDASDDSTDDASDDASDDSSNDTGDDGNSPNLTAILIGTGAGIIVLGTSVIILVKNKKKKLKK